MWLENAACQPARRLRFSIRNYKGGNYPSDPGPRLLTPKSSHNFYRAYFIHLEPPKTIYDISAHNRGPEPGDKGKLN